MKRIYLDHNATTPLRSEAKQAMIAAMGILGNPSSVHSEGRAAKAIVETARRQISDASGASGADIIFTSGATEAAALALANEGYLCAGIEHDCVSAWASDVLHTDETGLVRAEDPKNTALQYANSETGIVQDLPEGVAFCDAVQAFGKIPFAFSWSNVERAALSAHKFGGPKGVGVLMIKQGLDVKASLKGGGQEMGWRAGTENVIGIAGMGAAAKAAEQDLSNGVWDEIEERRNWLEDCLSAAADDMVVFGALQKRLPNTICLAVPEWRGETQVMQMDLAGFAISAGSACSSGKVKASRVIKAMGYDDNIASSVIRVSLGRDTTQAEVEKFAATWIEHYRRHKSRAA